MKNICIFGANGAIGGAFIAHILKHNNGANINAFVRDEPKNKQPGVKYHTIDYTNEASLKSSAEKATEGGELDLVIVAVGILHDDKTQPEKALKDLSAEKFHHIYEVNTVTPAMIAKYFVPHLAKEGMPIFAALSARVGSISDNGLGGWYAYRASKAALNMVIKNIAIEKARTNKSAIIVGLHPGTVDSNLSKPFQSFVKEGKLFTPTFAAEKLMEVIHNLKPDSSGKCFAWDGEQIYP